MFKRFLFSLFIKNKKLILLILLFTSTQVSAVDFTGVVKNSKGEFIVNAVVAIYATNKSTKTNQHGEFSLLDLPQGHFHVHVSANNYLQQDFELALTNLKVVKKVILAPSSLENIIVTASALNHSVLESASPVSVISEEDLVIQQAATLGETLANEPGVHSSYFGPVASSPIIRGLDGPRVRITQNGLNTGDVSRVGSDHAIATETATAEQIEILKGPATLMYGSGAIGGVINVVDQRIPQAPVEEFNGKLAIRKNTVSNGDNISTSLNGGSKQFSWHADAAYRSSDNYKLSHDEILENSDMEALTYTLGGTYFSGESFIGLSYGRIENKYGIPGHSHGDEHHDDNEEEHDDEHIEEDHDEHDDESERVYADMKQNRFQLISSLNSPLKGISKFDMKFAYADYQHGEIEEDSLSTLFQNRTHEARFEAFHNPIGEWQGVVGLHYEKSELQAAGFEAFTPPTTTSSLALFFVEERDFNKVNVSFGGRIENTDIKSSGLLLTDEGEEQLPKHSYQAFSGSAGLVWRYSDDYHLALSYAYSERAPSGSELYSNGEHVATQAYELGTQYQLIEDEEHLEIVLADKKIEKEVSNNLDLTWRKVSGSIGGSVTVFYNQVDNFIYQENTGFFFEEHHDEHGDEEEHQDEHGDEEEHHEEDELHDGELPIYLFAQADAELYGFETDFNFQLNDAWRLDVFSDYIRAKLKAGDNLPRIPPLRVGTKLNWESQQWHIDVAATWYDKQNKIADFETATSGYTMLTASVNYFTDYNGNDIHAFIKASNISDKEMRVHSSFIKDEVPLPGRNLTMGIQISF